MTNSELQTEETRGDSFTPRAVELTVVRPKLPKRAHHTTEQEHGQQPSHGHDHLAGNSHHKIGSDAHVHKLRIPQRPFVYSFARERFLPGIQNLIGSLLCLGLCGFMATQILTTPNLRIQIGLIAVICGLLGLYLLPMAIRDLFGRLRIDSNGITMSPGFVGFFIPWNDLSRWNVDVVTFRFHSPKKKWAMTTSYQVLSNADRHELRELMRACCAEKEGDDTNRVITFP